MRKTKFDFVGGKYVGCYILLFKVSENLIASPYFEQKKKLYEFVHLPNLHTTFITLELFVRITTLISKNTSSRCVLKDLNLSQSLKNFVKRQHTKQIFYLLTQNYF